MLSKYFRLFLNNFINCSSIFRIQLPYTNIKRVLKVFKFFTLHPPQTFHMSCSPISFFRSEYLQHSSKRWMVCPIKGRNIWQYFPGLDQDTVLRICTRHSFIKAYRSPPRVTQMQLIANISTCISMYFTYHVTSLETVFKLKCVCIQYISHSKENVRAHNKRFHYGRET